MRSSSYIRYYFLDVYNFFDDFEQNNINSILIDPAKESSEQLNIDILVHKLEYWLLVLLIKKVEHL